MPGQCAPELLRDVVPAVGVLQGEEELVVADGVAADGLRAASVVAAPVQVHLGA